MAMLRISGLSEREGFYEPVLDIDLIGRRGQVYCWLRDVSPSRCLELQLRNRNVIYGENGTKKFLLCPR
jgi:hypothetical protein